MGELLGSLVMWLVLSVVLEIPISWLWFSSGSVWPSWMLHAGSNLVLASGMTLVHGEDVNITTAIMCLAYLPVVVWIIASGHAGRASSAPGPSCETGQTREGVFAKVTPAIASR